MFLREMVQAPTSAVALSEVVGTYDLVFLVVLLVLLHLLHNLEMLLLAVKPCLHSFRPLLEEWYELKKLYSDLRRDYEDHNLHRSATIVTNSQSPRRVRSGNGSAQKEISTNPSPSKTHRTTTQNQIEAVRQVRKTREGEDGSLPLLSAAGHQEARQKGRRIR